MKKICNLSYDDFTTYDNFNETLPRYTNNLVGYFPYDDSLSNVIPEINISSENNNFKTYGMIAHQVSTLKNIKHNNNMIIFDGTTNFTINKNVLTNVKNFSIELCFSITSSSSDSVLLSFGDNNNIFTIKYYNQFDTLGLNIKNIISSKKDLTFNGEKNTLLLTNLGDIQINKLYKLKITLQNDVVVSLLDDDLKSTTDLKVKLNSDKIIVGQKLLDDVTSEAYDNNIGFKGQLKYIKINNYSCININNPVTAFGLCGNGIYPYDSKNLNVMCSKCKNTNRINLGDISSYKLTSDLIYKNESTKKSDFVYYEDNYVFSLKETGYLKPSSDYSLSFIYKNNTIHKFNIYLNRKELNSNITIIEENNITLDNDWTMYVLAFRNKSTSNLDMNLNLSIKSDIYIKVNTPINLIYSECHITNKNIPTFLIKNTPEIANTSSIIDMKDFTSTINNFSVGFEFIPYSFTTVGQYPQLLWLGEFTQDHTKDWLGIYRGSGWNNSEDIKISTTYSNIKVQKELADIKQNIVGHTVYIGVSFNKATNSFLVLIYDKTSKKYLLNQKLTDKDYNFTEFSSMLVNANGTTAFLRNLSIYNKPLSQKEFENNFIENFQIKEDGKIIISKLNESTPKLITASNIYKYKLNDESYNADNMIKNINTKSYYPYKDSILVGKYSCNLIVDLINNYETNEKFTSNCWNKNLHQDAVKIQGWVYGPYNADKYEEGYFSKFVHEGPNNEICLKFIDCNTKYGHPHRWIAAVRRIFKSEFSLWQQVSITKNFKVVFKARTDINESVLYCGFYRYSKSTKKIQKQILYPVKVNNNWNEYSVEINIDDDWDLSQDAELNIAMEKNTEESTIWVSDVLINISNNNIPIDILKNPQANKVLNLNINSLMKENESFKTTDDFFIKPWTIMYWKKPITPASTTSYYSLDSFGQYLNNTPNLSYLYIGHNSIVNNFIFYFKGNTKYITLNDDDYFNHWHLISIRYDGTGINAKILGEKMKFDETIPGVIPTNDFLQKKEDNRDLCLGGWCANDNYCCSCSLYKDLMISSSALTDKEIYEIFRKKFSYKDNNIIAQCNLKEI